MLVIAICLAIIAVVQYFHHASEAIGNWNHLFPNMQLDPNDFYDLIEELLEDREIPDINTHRRTFKQGGIFSYHRIYLEVSRKDYIFHICAAPWGIGFFFSWWIREKLSPADELLILIPYFGPRIVRARQYKSYYKLDTDAMFRKSVHQCVMDAIDQLTNQVGIRALTEFERQPDLRSILK